MRIKNYITMLVINKIMLCCIQFGMLYLISFNISYVHSANYKIVDGSCEDEGTFLDNTYEPADVYNVFSTENITFLTEIGRTADYAILSPIIFKVGCIDLSKYFSTESDIRANKMNQATGTYSLFECRLFCARTTEDLHTNASQLMFVYENTTCYCLIGVIETSMVNDKCLNEDNVTNRDYANVYGVYGISNSSITEIVPYDKHLILCQYVSVTSTNDVSLVFGKCNLRVDGIICNTNSSTASPMCTDIFGNQCVLYENPGTLEDAQSRCTIYFGNLTYKPNLNNLRSVLIGYRNDKLYALNGYREIYIYKRKLNGTKCVYVLKNGDNVFITIENCSIIRPNVCLHEYTEVYMKMFIVLGIPILICLCALFISFLWYCLELCMVYKCIYGIIFWKISCNCESTRIGCCRNEHDNNVNFDSNEIELHKSNRQTERYIDTNHSDDEHVHVSNALLSNIDVECDAVPGKILHDDGTTFVHDSNVMNSDLDNDGGAVPGRILDEPGSGFIYIVDIKHSYTNTTLHNDTSASFR